MVTTIRITRLRWAGNIVRMQDNLPCKKITLDNPEGRRRVGRPNLRWLDGVMRDAERLGVRNWRINPLNPELNPICYLLALLAHHFLHVSRIRVKSLTLRLLSYIYIYIYIYMWSAYS